MKIIKKIFLILAIPVSCLLSPVSFATEIFDEDTPVVGDIRVHDASAFFAELFQKLNSVKFADKDIRVALESLETLSPNVKIAATDHRIVVVRGDDIIGNWPRPVDNNWLEIGEITTALLLKIREGDANLARMPQGALYSVSVAAITHALDANGRYVSATLDDGKVLTSAGLQGARDARGYWRVSGVVSGSQADASGINDGDLIVGINGADVSALSDAALAAEFAGFNSGTLKLKVARSTGTKDIVLRRASVQMADADIVYRTDSSQQIADSKVNILEIIIHDISENAVGIVNQALAKYGDASGIILDLRSARGGDEVAAAKLAGLFLGAVPVMRIQGGGEELEVIPGSNAMTDAPVVVLISGNTIGTAEAVALAFHDNARGALVGTPSAGDARLITKIDLSVGGVIELGNRIVKSGNGAVIHERGVFPLVCLSNIRNNQQQEAFFINVINGDFNAKDYNKDQPGGGGESEFIATIRKGCPAFKSGADEDLVSSAVAIKILTDDKVYKGL
jgi:C-terminal processing protease CtpA/Prc